MWYTDDLGKSWTASKTQFPQMDEAQLVELGKGVVMANMRNYHVSVHFDIALSFDRDLLVVLLYLLTEAILSAISTTILF